MSSLQLVEPPLDVYKRQVTNWSMAGGRRRKGRKMDRKIKAIENALWTRRGKTIVTKNLNRWRRSPSLASDIYELDRCVVEYQSDDELVLSLIHI